MFTETCNVVIAGKPAYYTTRIRQVIRELNQCFGSISRVGYNTCIKSSHSQRIVLHGSTERNKLFTESSKIIISCEPAYRTACIRHSISKFNQSLTCCNAILNYIGFNSGNGYAILFHGSTERNKLFTKCIHVILAGKETDNTSTVWYSSSHLSEGFTCRSSFSNNFSVQTSNFIAKALHRLTKWNELFAESVHIILTGEPANHTARIRKCSRHFSQGLTCDCSICDSFAIDAGNFNRELLHSLTKRNQIFSKASKRGTASQPRSNSVKNIRGSQDKDGFGKSLNAIHHRGINSRRTLYERLNIGHETRKIGSNLRELTGYTTCKSTNNTANEFTNSYTNTLEQIATLIDKPFQTRNLSQCTNCCQHKSKLSNNHAHAKNANHSTRHQCGNSGKSGHNSRQQTDTNDTLK